MPTNLTDNFLPNDPLLEDLSRPTLGFTTHTCNLIESVYLKYMEINTKNISYILAEASMFSNFCKQATFTKSYTIIYLIISV